MTLAKQRADALDLIQGPQVAREALAQATLGLRSVITALDFRASLSVVIPEIALAIIRDRGAPDPRVALRSRLGLRPSGM